MSDFCKLIPCKSRKDHRGKYRQGGADDHAQDEVIHAGIVFFEEPRCRLVVKRDSYKHLFLA